MFVVSYTAQSGDKVERFFLAESLARSFTANLLEVDENSDPCIIPVKA